MEFTTLVIFAVVALVKVYVDHPAHSIEPTASWFNPFDISSLSALNGGILLAVFIYWGWDSGVSVNEETEDSSTAPGRAAIVSTFVLVAIYLLVATAAQAFGGVTSLANNPTDVLNPLGQGSARLAAGQAADHRGPVIGFGLDPDDDPPDGSDDAVDGAGEGDSERFGNVHPRFLSPGFSTIAMGVVSTSVYVLLAITSPANLIGDAFTSLALTIAFYYGFTGFACVIFYRRELFKSLKNFVYIGVLPFFGGAVLTFVLIKAILVYSKPHAGFAKPFLGIGSPVAIALLTIIIGIVCMFIQRITMPEFFRRKPEVVDPALVATAPAGRSS